MEKAAFFNNISYSLGKIYKYLCNSNVEKLTEPKSCEILKNTSKRGKYVSSTSSKNVNNRQDHIDKEIAEINDKFSRLMGPPARSHLLRKTCTRSNETETSVREQTNNNIDLNERNSKCRNDMKIVFDIVTNDGKRFQLDPMRLSNTNWMLSCLENYLGINK